MNCVICQKPVSQVFSASGFPVFECDSCLHRMTEIKTPPDVHIAGIYSRDYFFGGGAGYPDYLAEKAILTRHGGYYGRLLSKYAAQPGRVLDVGAAAGFILKGLTEAGWSGCGIEPNECMSAYARDTLGLEVKTGNLESFQSEEPFDAITMIQVIAHFIDPLRAVRAACNALKKDGLIIVETWNYRSLTAKLAGARWHEYSPPGVLHWFSPGSLNRLMTRSNCEQVATGRPPKRITWQHARSLLQYKAGHNSLPARALDLLRIIPDGAVIPYPAEDLFWSVFRKK